MDKKLMKEHGLVVAGKDYPQPTDDQLIASRTLTSKKDHPKTWFAIARGSDHRQSRGWKSCWSAVLPAW